ncbi:hypothetical protein [Pseudalkalibacillus hwajinpoensis]|nr:hypothetical protein [Pseudalkalibacillus hwajinpoensis]
MKKADIQALYREVKRRRRANKNSSSPKKATGCKSCGKTNWRPNQ